MKFDNATVYPFQKPTVCQHLFFRSLNIEFKQINASNPLSSQVSSIVDACTLTEVLLFAIELPQAGASVLR